MPGCLLFSYVKNTLNERFGIIPLYKSVSLGSNESSAITFSSSEILEALNGRKFCYAIPCPSCGNWNIGDEYSWKTLNASQMPTELTDYKCTIKSELSGGSTVHSVCLLIFYTD